MSVATATSTGGTRAMVVLAVLIAAPLVWQFRLTAEMPALLLFGCAGAILIVVDIREHRLPNHIVLPALAGVIVLLAAASFSERSFEVLGQALLGSAAMFGLYLTIALISPAAMGMGDVKLAALVGLSLAWFGWGAWFAGLIAAFVIGGGWALAALVTRRASARYTVPFGPAMIIGALLVILGVAPATEVIAGA